ncbi:tRNA (guanine(37)-N(1))-methyltransferase [Methylobacterium radiotolerans]|uniref:tRNA (guanine(37)-N(1))-methyltransferase n=1 Tax=Methylobacterium radiotolerans TaxID=31998 RepID=UPI003AF4BFDA
MPIPSATRANSPALSRSASEDQRGATISATGRSGLGKAPAGAPGAAGPDDARPRLLMSPRGRPLTQARVRDLAAGPGALIVCGRFEGVDERVIAGRGLEEVSIGDYVLSGGEIAALVVLDACVRLLPGVMGKIESGVEESFEGGLLEYPHYTRPRDWEGRAIPDVLSGGNHAAIARWRRAEAERITAERRPDLLGGTGPGQASSRSITGPSRS